VFESLAVAFASVAARAIPTLPTLHFAFFPPFLGYPFFMTAADRFALSRFLLAQENSYETPLAELRRGTKRSHWMWFIFPQIAGLGSSPTAQLYAIKSREEAEAYIQHPILGTRLAACAEALLDVEGKSVSDIMGYPDDLKLRSSATLFAEVSQPGSVFHRLLDKYFAGDPDPHTLAILAGKR
jgi:uncharacterized protein (DUF1810 family)